MEITNNTLESEEFSEEEIAALQAFDNKKAIASINKENLSFDQYIFTITDIELDINNKEISRHLNNIKLIVFPFNKEQTTYGYSTELAVYLQEGETFNCGASSKNGRKSILVTTNNHGFVVNGRWIKEHFISYANTMSDIAENREVSQDKQEFRAKDEGVGHIILDIDNWEVHIMPLSLENQGIYVPIMLILSDKNNNETFVCAANTYFEYKDMKIGGRWYEDEFVCFAL